ncbi:MAG: DsbA family protein [Gammaproteobacteria bacterium]|nr:DsbA family protein [Gammaproteobacteria bacterium]
MVTLFYIHDPMCSWCWGYQPVWQDLLQNMPENISVTYVLGGLAQDSDEPMTDELQATIQAHWRRIQNELGTEFNYDFWRHCQPRRSTYPACRAVIAAAKQNTDVAMIRAIQRAYYLRAMNPSNNETLCVLAEELALDVEMFRADLVSASTEESLQEQITCSRSLSVNGFPSLVLNYNNELHHLAIDYKNYQTTLKQIVDIFP